MVKHLFIALLLAAPSLASRQAFGAQVAAGLQSSEPEQEVLGINKEYADAVLKNDTSTLARLFADDFAGTAFNGQPTSKAAMTVSNNTPTATLISYVETDVKVRIFGVTAVVTSRAALKTRLSDGRVISRRNALTKVWLKRGGRWQIISNHMSWMPPLMLPPESAKQEQGLSNSPWLRFGKVEQEALVAHLDYLRQSSGPEEAERRYAPGLFITAATGMVSEREELIRRLKENAERPAPPQVFTAGNQILLLINNSTVVLDDFRAQAYDNTVAISYRTTSFNRGGQVTGQARVGCVYLKRDGRWQQIFGQTTEVIAESTR